ncbi:pyruvate, water dikinase regulatory protein [Brachymonas sp.]|uniref:posphoenolpyruvate synthetase regulatory kinase/phosphorylase PpsR n=1 Tax=Brachymonas sp. TaxID=1936292 RepID=UPI0035AF817A
MQSTGLVRTVFFVSDSTGTTAETFGNSILAQFDLTIKRVRKPFVNDLQKAEELIDEINRISANGADRPIVFSTLVNLEIGRVINEKAHALVLDMIAMFLNPLEKELGIKSHHRVGRYSDISQNKAYADRIEAINYSLSHDDGQTNRDLAQSDVILIGVSRSGKTPTSLYLAMQHGLKVSNYPLIPEDFERMQLPPALVPYKHKLFGLTIDPARLSQIRNERRPHSHYASLENCRKEVAAAESMMRRSDVRWLSTTHKSIEEISATILQEIKPEKLN